MRFARAVRTRWRTLLLVTGAVLTVLGVVLASGAVLLPGILLLLFALLHGIGSSGCTSADLAGGWPQHRSDRVYVARPAGPVPVRPCQDPGAHRTP